MTKIHDLLDLPQSVRKGDFVQMLTDSIDHPEQTVATYAVTGAILATFDHALSIIDSAVKTGTSQAAYLHGSFGSGKSHFMALLHLMLQDHPAPWGRGELHPLKAKFDWIGDKKLLQLPMHFMNAKSIEDKIFDTYVRWVEDNHPDAPVPALYADKELFENAAALRADLGNERFFAKLNGARPAAAKGWGKLTATWDLASFEAAIESSDDEAREQLFSDLLKSHFPAFARQTGRFVELDRGLQVLASHAKALGHDAVVLYLDELILWLASSASDMTFIQREVQKLVQLKEAQNIRRDIPIVSFVAQQRDLANLVGEQAKGSDRAALEDCLKHHQGRFDEVKLADTNLPAIVEHRVVRPRSDGARETLADGFARVWNSAGMARGTLVGTVGTEEAFRKVFPFSPALVEALVDLSDCLQRERTAIRILMELLVEHLPELELGPVVPVGDAFDVIAGGEDPFDQVMRARFNRARHMYQDMFLPMIQAEHGTETAEDCQRLRSGHPKKLGCSSCPKDACRNDNRLAKTLLMAALAPGAEVFKGLTVRKLVHLNHGTIATPIPGAEVRVAAEKLKKWSAHVGPLRVGDEADPELTLHLDRVDLKPIIDKARAYDSPGARRLHLRLLLFGQLGLPGDTTQVEYTAVYRGIKRKGLIRFGNVREMSDSQLTIPGKYEWYVIFDFPFDQGGHSPEDDLLRVEQFRDSTDDEEQPTAVWLPTFFSHKLEETLGDFVALQHILDGRTQEYLGHLRPEDQVTAREDLTSLRDQKREQLVRALNTAYRITGKDNDPVLDPSRTVEHPVIPLSSTLKMRPPLVGKMTDGLKQVVEQLMGHRYPSHPKFGATVTDGKLEKVRVLLEKLIESPERRITVPPPEGKDLQNYADPLGLTSSREGVINLLTRPLDDLDQLRRQDDAGQHTVADLRRFTDLKGLLGLTLPLKDLLVWSYVLWSGRSLRVGSRDVELKKLGQLPEDAELVRAELPEETAWQQALTRAAELWGVSFANRHLSARNLAKLCTQVKEAGARTRGARKLVSVLERKLDSWADRAGAQRLTTACSAAAAVDIVDQADGSELVTRLAAYVPETSATAVSKSLTTGADVAAALESEARWLNFSTVRGLLNHPRKQHRAQQLLDDLALALQADELNKPLTAALVELTHQAAELITPPRRDWRQVHSASVEVDGAQGYEAALSDLASKLEQQAAEQGAEVELKLDVTAVLLRRNKEEE